MSQYVMTKSELYHHGIKGQKWGERRFQEEDGSLTAAGRERYGYGNGTSKRESVIQRDREARANKNINRYNDTTPKREAAIKFKKVSSSMKEYDEKDPDFKMFYGDSDASAESHRLKGTDFYLYTRPDGSKVMFEEDMKWDIPAGMSKEEIIEMTKGIMEDFQQNSKRLSDLADDVIKGKYGNGADRVKALGKDYDRVQEIVNARLKVRHSDLGGYELYHHGILGQKWGIRRFQNKDGSYTNEGKERRRENYGEQIKRTAGNFYSQNKNTIAKIGKTAAIAAGVGIAAYLIAKNKDVVVSALNDSAKRVGKSMLDASLASVGMIAIDKLSSKLPTDNSIDERTRYKNRILLDTASAGIKEATKASGSSNNNNSGVNVGKEVTDKLGPPSNKGLDRQSNAYQNLFKDTNGNQRDSTTRAVIKSLASKGYDLEQLQEYVRGIDNGTIKHSLQDVGYFAINYLLDNDFV